MAPVSRPSTHQVPDCPTAVPQPAHTCLMWLCERRASLLGKLRRQGRTIPPWATSAGSCSRCSRGQTQDTTRSANLSRSLVPLPAQMLRTLAPAQRKASTPCKSPRLGWPYWAPAAAGLVLLHSPRRLLLAPVTACRTAAARGQPLMCRRAQQPQALPTPAEAAWHMSGAGLCDRSNRGRVAWQSCGSSWAAAPERLASARRDSCARRCGRTRRPGAGGGLPAAAAPADTGPHAPQQGRQGSQGEPAWVPSGRPAASAQGWRGQGPENASDAAQGALPDCFCLGRTSRRAGADAVAVALLHG